MHIELEKRPNASKLFTFLSPFIALFLTLVCGFILFAALGKDPWQALYLFFIDPLREEWSLHELAIKAGPLILIGVGLSICYRAGNWNIGAEGQFIFGAIFGSFLPIVFYQWTSPLVLPLMLILGMVGGALYAAIPALLKTRFNTNEILTSLMLVYIAQLFLDYLVRGPWRNPEGQNFPESRHARPWPGASMLRKSRVVSATRIPVAFSKAGLPRGRSTTPPWRASWPLSSSGSRQNGSDGVPRKARNLQLRSPPRLRISNATFRSRSPAF